MTPGMPLSVSPWSAARPAAVLVGALVAFLIVQWVHLYWVVAWGERQTRGLNYFGRPLPQRRRFKRTLYRHRLALGPIIWLLSRASRLRFSRVSFCYRGVAGPKGTCSPQSFQEATRYRPRPEDVFVATQMKCGTTWMQHVVYQVLTRGSGDLAGSGTALYAVSPWIESVRSVSIDDAPLVGAERPSRIIKTHLPVQLCPYSQQAKYIYVVRHPLSCFASSADFIATSVGAFTVHLEDIEKWFCSRALMWWGTWPAHVCGWWALAQERENVLFVSFEEMKRDLAAVVRQVAGFLQIDGLREEEVEQIVRKCSFQYMREHAEAFEMTPPHVLQTRGALFVSGKAERHRDVPQAICERILAWCRLELAASSFPLERYYPDVAASLTPPPARGMGRGSWA